VPLGGSKKFLTSNPSSRDLSAVSSHYWVEPLRALAVTGEHSKSELGMISE
jgi:hypothetical protein